MVERVVICGEGVPYDVFVGRGPSPKGGGLSPWAIPASISLEDEAAAGVAYRVWLWEEISAGRVDVAALAGLNCKVFGVRSREEAAHVEVLRSAAFWALAQQARRLEERVAGLLGRR